MTFDKLKLFLQEIPFNTHVGLKLVRLHKDGVTIECTIRPELLNGSGVLHGGVTATVADVAVGMRLCCGRVEVFDREKRPVAAALITYMILDG
jgi:acyl-coenzyme A thioesterase PaaI-like protein